MFDCHVHSCFSGDSEMPAAAACEKAILEGLEGITFTDHLDFDYPGFPDEYFMIDFSEYCSSMEQTRSDFSPELKVLTGIEIGIQPHVIEKTIKVVESHPFDYVLASIHILDGLDPYVAAFYEGKTKNEAYSRYLKEILFMVSTIDNFDNFGHPEYITRYAAYEDRTLLYADHSDLFDEIFRTIIAKGKGMELNTGSFKEFPGKVTPLYDINVLKRYRELGGEIVTLGSDAHFPQYVGYKFNEFRNLLLEAGFKHVAHFEKRKPVFDRL